MIVHIDDNSSRTVEQRRPNDNSKENRRRNCGAGAATKVRKMRNSRGEGEWEVDVCTPTWCRRVQMRCFDTRVTKMKEIRRTYVSTPNLSLAVPDLVISGASWKHDDCSLRLLVVVVLLMSDCRNKAVNTWNKTFTRRERPRRSATGLLRGSFEVCIFLMHNPRPFSWGLARRFDVD